MTVALVYVTVVRTSFCCSELTALVYSRDSLTSRLYLIPSTIANMTSLAFVILTLTLEKLPADDQMNLLNMEFNKSILRILHATYNNVLHGSDQYCSKPPLLV